MQRKNGILISNHISTPLPDETKEACFSFPTCLKCKYLVFFKNSCLSHLLKHKFWDFQSRRWCRQTWLASSYNHIEITTIEQPSLRNVRNWAEMEVWQLWNERNHTHPDWQEGHRCGMGWSQTHVDQTLGGTFGNEESQTQTVTGCSRGGGGAQIGICNGVQNSGCSGNIREKMYMMSSPPPVWAGGWDTWSRAIESCFVQQELCS